MKIGLVVGVFDIYHIGHVLMLEECSAKCDHLVVALNKADHIDPSINPDKKPPIFSIEQRIRVMKSCKYVDEVVTYGNEDELIELMDGRTFDIRFLGDDYKGKPITEGSKPIPIHYIDRSHGWSTSKVKALLNQ